MPANRNRSMYLFYPNAICILSQIPYSYSVLRALYFQKFAGQAIHRSGRSQRSQFGSAPDPAHWPADPASSDVTQLGQGRTVGMERPGTGQVGTASSDVTQLGQGRTVGVERPGTGQVGIASSDVTQLGQGRTVGVERLGTGQVGKASSDVT